MSSRDFSYNLNLQAKGAESVSAAQRILDQFYASLGKGAVETKKFSDSFNQGTQAVSSSSQKLTQSSTQLVRSLDQQKAGYQGVAQTQNTYKTSLDQVVTTQSRVGQSLKATETSLKAQDQTFKTTKTSIDQFKTSTDQMLTSEGKVVTTTKQVTDAVNQQKTAFSAGKTTVDQFKTSTDQMLTSQGRISTAVKGSTTEINLFKTAQQQSLSTMQQVNTQATATTSTFSTMKLNIVGLTGGIAALGGSLAGLYNSYDAIGDAYLNVEKRMTAHKRAQDTLVQLQIRYNDTVKREGEDSAKAQLYMSKIITQKEDLANKIGDLENAQEAYNEAQLNFATTIAPQVITTMGGIAAIAGNSIPIFTKLRGASSGVAADLSKVAPAATSAGTGLASAGGAAAGARVGMAGLAAAAGPLVLAIAAVAGGVLAVNQNFFGFRDILNNAGKALGDLIPATQGSLNVIKGFAGQIGLSGEATEEWSKALTLGLEQTHEKWVWWSGEANKFLEIYAKGLDEVGFAVQDTIKVLNGMGESIGKWSSDVQTGFNMVVTEANSMGGQLQKAVEDGIKFMSDPKTWTNAWNGLVSMGASAAENAMTVVQQKINEFGRWVFGHDQWDNLVLTAQDAAKSSVKVIQDTLSGVTSWIQKNVIDPAASQIDSKIVQPLMASLPRPDENVAAQQQRALSFQDQEILRKKLESQGSSIGITWDDQNRRTLVSPLVDTFGALPVQTKAPTTPQTSGKAPPTVAQPTVFGMPVGGSNSIVGTANAIKQAGDEQSKANDNIRIGTTLLEGVREGWASLTNPVGEAAGATTDASAATEEMGTATKLAAQETEYFKEGVTEQNNAVEMGARANLKTAGTVTTLKEQLKEGAIQVVSFTAGFAEASKKFLETQLATQKLGGEILFLSQTLGTTEGIMTRFNSGFVTGAKSILDWAGSFDTIRGTAQGTRQSLIQVANTLGVSVPEAFKGSADAMKQFISYTKASGAEFESLMTKMTSDFESMTGGLGDAMRKSNKDLNTQIDELEEKLGVEFNEGMKDALKLEGGTDAIMSLGKDFSTLVKELQLDPGSFNNFKGQIEDQMEETFDDIPEELQPMAEGAMRNLIVALNAPVDLSDPNSINAYLGVLNAALLEFDRIGSATAESWGVSAGHINDTKFDKLRGEIEAIKKDVFGLGGAWDQVKYSMETFSLEKPVDNLEFEDNGSPDPNDESRWLGGQGGGSNTTVKAPMGPSSGSTGSSGASKTSRTGPTKSLAGTSAGLNAEAKGQTGGGAGTAIDLTLWQSNLDEAQGLFTSFMSTIFENAASIPAGVMAGIDPLREMIGQAWLDIRAGTTSAISMIIQEAQALGPGIAGGFQAAQEPSGSAMLSILDGVKGVVSTIIQEAQAIAPGIAGAFSSARTQAQPHISGLSEDFASNAVAPIEAMSSGIGETIGSAFEEGGRRAVTALGNIYDTAENARSKVQEVADAVNALPETKTVEIVVSVVGDAIPAQLNASGWGPGIVNKPGGVNFTAGEAGPELVSIIPLSKMGSLGKGGDGMTRISAAEGFQGVVGTQTGPQLMHGNRPGGPTQTQYGNIQNVNVAMIGGVPVNSLGGAFGTMPVSVIGGSGSGGFGGGGGGSSGGGSGSGGGGGQQGGGGSGQTPTTPSYTTPAHVKETGTGKKWQGSNPDPNSWSVTEMTDPDKKGMFKVVDDDGKNIAAEFTSREEAEAYLNAKKGGGSGGVGQVPGMPGGPLPTPTIPRKPPTGPGGIYGERVTGSGHADIGISQPAKKRIQQTPGINARNEVELLNGDRYTVEEWNATPDTHRRILAEQYGFFAIPEGAFINEDYTITPHHFQRPINSPRGPNPFDPNPNAGMPGTGQVPTQPGGGGQTPSTDWSHVQTSGSGSKWGPHGDDPEQWEAVKMKDDPSKWKLVDEHTGKNIAAGFRSKEEAEQWAREHATGTGVSTPGGPSDPNIGTVGNGGTTPGGFPTQPGGGGGGSGTIIGTGQPRSPGYIKPGGWGAGGWYEDWDIVPMSTNPGKYKVIDLSDGKTLAQDFDSVEQAQSWIEWYKANPTYRPPGSQHQGEGLNIPNANDIEGQPPGYGGQPMPGTGGDGTGGFPTQPGGGGGGGGQTPTTGYTPPSGIQTSGTGSKWGGHNPDPNTWKTVTMQDDPNLWKVIDDKGKNVAAKFSSQEDAQAYIDNERAAKNGTGGGGTTPGGFPIQNGSTQTNVQNGPGNNYNYQSNNGGINTQGGVLGVDENGNPIRRYPTVYVNGIPQTTPYGPGNIAPWGPQGPPGWMAGGQVGSNAYWKGPGGSYSGPSWMPEWMDPNQATPWNPYPGVIPLPPGAGGLVGIGNNVNQQSQSTQQIVDAKNGIVKQGNQIVDAKNGIVMQNGQIVDAKNGIVIQNGKIVNGKTGTITDIGGGGGGFGGIGRPVGPWSFGQWGIPVGPNRPQADPMPAYDNTIPTGQIFPSGSGYTGREPGAGGIGRPVMPGLPTFPPWLGTGGPATGSQVNTISNGNQTITQSQSITQSSSIVSGNGIVGQGNNVAIMRQVNTGSNVSVNGVQTGSGANTTTTPPWLSGEGPSYMWPMGTGAKGGPAQHYEYQTFERPEEVGGGTGALINMNMTPSQIQRMMAMMAASGQEHEMTSTGMPAVTGFRYSAAGWLGSRPTPTARQLRSGRDNDIPIWDTGMVNYGADVGVHTGAGISPNITRPRGPATGNWDIGGLVDMLKNNILEALNAALGKMAININLNNSRISDAQTRIMMRGLDGQL